MPLKLYSTLIKLFLVTGPEVEMPIIFENSLGFGTGFAASFEHNVMYQSWSRVNNDCYNCKAFYIKFIFSDMLDGIHILKMCRFIAKDPLEIIKWVSLITKNILKLQKIFKDQLKVMHLCIFVNFQEKNRKIW